MSSWHAYSRHPYFRLLSTLMGLLFLVKLDQLSASTTISAEPCAIYTTPHSIIERLADAHYLYAGDRKRLSTCTGVAWFPSGEKLVSVNLLENSLRTYLFDSHESTLKSDYFLNDSRISKLGFPENLCFSKEGSLLAISNSQTGYLNIYRVDLEKSEIDPSPLQFKNGKDQGLHGVRFSSRGNFLAYVTYDGLGKIQIYRLSYQSPEPSLTAVQTINCSFEGLAPKGIDFSDDDRYVAISYCGKAGSSPRPRTGLLAIYAFDEDNGMLNPSPVDLVGLDAGLNIPEDVCFGPDSTYILVSNQGNDTVTIHDFNPATKRITDSRVALKNPQAQLNFPHGIALSPDHRYLAVTNYGDDKIAIYSVFSEPTKQ